MEGPAIGQRPRRRRRTAVRVADRHHSSRSGRPIPTEATSGQQDIGHKQQGAEHRRKIRSRPVVRLDLAAEAVGGARPLGIGVPAVPFALVQGHPVGLGGGGRGAAGQPLAAAACGRCRCSRNSRPQERPRRSRAAARPGSWDRASVQRVGQGGARRPEASRVSMPNPAPEGPEQPREQHVHAQEHPGPQQPGGGPAPGWRTRPEGAASSQAQRRAPAARARAGMHSRKTSSTTRTRSGLQPLCRSGWASSCGGSVRGRAASGRRGRRTRRSSSSGSSSRSVPGMQLAPGGGPPPGRSAPSSSNIWSAYSSALRAHIFEKGGQSGLLLREGHHGRAVLLLPRRQRPPPAARPPAGHSAPWGGGCRDRRGAAPGNGHHACPGSLRPGGWRLAAAGRRSGCTGTAARSGALAPRGAELRQDLVQGEAHVSPPPGSGTSAGSVRRLLFGFLAVLISIVVIPDTVGRGLAHGRERGRHQIKVSSPCAGARPRTAGRRRRPRRSRELILPNMGMETVKSQVSATRRPMPSPSLPMTMAAGPFRSASYREVVPVRGGAEHPDPLLLQLLEQGGQVGHPGHGHVGHRPGGGLGHHGGQPGGAALGDDDPVGPGARRRCG